MSYRSIMLASAAGALLAACTQQSKPPATMSAATEQSAPAVQDAATRMRQLFSDSDEANLKLNPLNALYRGDMRYAARFGDMLSDAHIAAERAAAEDDLKRLAAIDRAQLSQTDQVLYDTFKWQRTLDLRGLQPDLAAIEVELPIDHFNGLHIYFPDLSSGEGAAPYKTVADYENGLSRIDGFVAFLDEAIVRFREGAAKGVTQPKLVVNNMVGQLDDLIAQGVDKSTFYGPIRKMPATFEDADKTRLTSAYRAAIATKIDPAFKRLRDFLKTEYLPEARASVGLSQMPGGAAYYAYLVERQTTTTMTPEEIHQLGLSEVARIKQGMETIKTRVGFKGSLSKFFDYVRNDPKFKLPTVQALGDGYRAIGKRVDAAVPKLFSTIPKAPLEIRPVPSYIEKTSAGAYYMQGTPDGSRPGVFYYNSYDLPSRTTPGMETLYLHEAIPGHHFQISLAQENASLPNFLRFDGNTAYVEGWALYSESLGPELGMETDPYQRFGAYDDEMMRAMRLVVDTGIHTKGWTRDQAIAYMLANSSMGKTDATAEVERYIAYPAQALAYKVGQLTIRKLRTKAEQALGPKFDVRAFHEQVLMTGALPMEVLEAKIDNWIAAQR